MRGFGFALAAGLSTLVVRCSNDNELGSGTTGDASVSPTGGSAGDSGRGGATTEGSGGAFDSGGSGNAAGSGGAGSAAGSGGLDSVAGAGSSGKNDSGTGPECIEAADCPQPGGLCSAAECVEGLCRHVNVCPTDSGAGELCGGEPCMSTRCAGIGCGAAVCCPSERGPVCLRGESTCPDESADAVQLQCFGKPLGVVLSKSCSQTSDCFIGLHWAGCCGLLAVGLNVAEQPLFDWFEPNCGGAPPCGCCCDSTLADDGTSLPGSDVSEFAVECVSGICQTGVR